MQVVSYLLLFLLLVEMFDKTLRDAARTKRVTDFNVIGAIPSMFSSRYGGMTKTYVQSSVKELTNSLLRSSPSENLPEYI